MEKAAALAAYNKARRTHGSVIDRRDVKKRHSRCWLPEAMNRAIAAGVAEATVVRALEGVAQELKWSLPRLREAFRLLRMGAEDERDIALSGVTMGRFREEMKRCGLLDVMLKDT